MKNERYRQLIEQEARHWGSVQPDPRNPQIWNDDRLFDIFFGKEYRHFLARIDAAGKDVLELGCGEGHLAVELARRGHKVAALDLSPERIQRAKQRAELHTLTHGATFNVGDLNIIDLPRQKFHCVVAHDALHHIYKLDHALDEAKNALKPGGRLIVIDYVGMSGMRKALAAALYALLLTYKPYTEKWALRNRLSTFLAPEAKKRNSLESGSTAGLHPESPFEEISQHSIIKKIRERFTIVEQFSFCPFWYYLAPKVRLPHAWRYQASKWLHEMDTELLSLGMTGAYFFIEAQKT